LTLSILKRLQKRLKMPDRDIGEEIVAGIREIKGFKEGKV
jgi:hypothetical protein